MSASPSTSPPHTPNDPRMTPKSGTPNSDESSIIDDLSFDYIFDEAGNFVRLSKGSSAKSNHSSPSTPSEEALDPPPAPKSPSPDLPESPIPRISLSRSESAFPVLSGNGVGTSTSAVTQEKHPARSFQRVASGPASSSTPSYLAPTASSLSKPRTVPRRITMEESKDRHEGLASSRARPTLDGHHYGLQEEKENISESDDYPHPQAVSLSQKNRNSPPLASRSVSSSRLGTSRSLYGTSSTSGAGSRPLAELQLAQRNPHLKIISGPTRPGRVMKSVSASKYGGTTGVNTGFDRISEGDMSEGEHPYDIPLPGDDTEPEDEPIDVEPAVGSIPSGSHMAASRTRAPSGLSSNAALSQSGASRPRRSASLSDALNNDDYQLQLQQPYRNPNSRPGTSQGMNNDNTAGARRVLAEPRERHDSGGRSDLKRVRTQTDEVERRDDQYGMRGSPSPTHNQHFQASRTVYGHRRRDSDTLRSFVPPSSSVGSPTVVEHNRGSPPLSSRVAGRHSPPSTAASRGRVSPPSKGRLSPPTSKGRLSPPTAKGRLSPSAPKGPSPPAASKIAKEVAKHRRSPTAPEPITNGSSLREASAGPGAKSWGNVEKVEEEYDYAAEREREREKEREREREREQQEQAERAEREKERERRQPPQLSIQNPAHLQQQQHVQPAIVAPTPTTVNAPAPPQAQLNRHIVVNKKAYARLDMIGKGGSSRVFRVLNHANELYAIKRVSLDKTDPETMNGYINEIKLLKRLEGNNRIIRLIDSELKTGPGGGKGHLLLVMECGEIDLARLLQEQMKEPVNMVWVAYYWQQMLQAVHVIHEEKIVHSDLKPANFVLVRGQLKLIDFGIANAIANDTTNIQRDHQIGTVNYMSPEAIELPEGMRRLKVGRPSDVWSLGCILYQMVYGHPPFQHLSVYQKMKAIPDLTHVIEFAEYATPTMPSPRNSTSADGRVDPPKKLDHLKVKVRKDVIMSMKSCLCRTPKERATIPELLGHSWLGEESAAPGAAPEPEPPVLKDLLKSDETVINPYYMRQLLEYGIKLGQSQQDMAKNPELLLVEAERLVQELKSLTVT
ncbi:hypothetical protein CVT24_011038 [Panaeolus cyanescens]|uniref:Protein kinase domain-containing protein n=1 Tax=Panaeolus cyanescens TaxID=181874 RepID=A0A409VFV4_9AGAR|nr:hypothetical protein CVT24_011038 [Panaeolus cyanescens]